VQRIHGTLVILLLEEVTSTKLDFGDICSYV